MCDINLLVNNDVLSPIYIPLALLILSKLRSTLNDRVCFHNTKCRQTKPFLQYLIYNKIFNIFFKA